MPCPLPGAKYVKYVVDCAEFIPQIPFIEFEAGLPQMKAKNYEVCNWLSLPKKAVGIRQCSTEWRLVEVQNIFGKWWVYWVVQCSVTWRCQLQESYSTAPVCAPPLDGYVGEVHSAAPAWLNRRGYYSYNFISYNLHFGPLKTLHTQFGQWHECNVHMNHAAYL